MSLRADSHTGPRVGEKVERFEVEKAWLVDPASGREGPGEIVVSGGVLESVVWLEGKDALGVTDAGVVVAPGFLDLHAHFREPGFEDAETVATGSAAAAHGGYTSVALMPNTEPAVDEPGVLERIRSAARSNGSPVEIFAYGAVSVDRAGEQLSAMGELADAGVLGYSDDGAPVRTSKLLRSALLYAGMLGLPVVDHAEDTAMTAGAEAAEGYVASVMGLAGWPEAAEVNAVSRDLAVFADALRDEPRARLHLTHVSTAAGLDLVRRAKAAGLPVTCDVTPHHMAFTDEWIAGARRWSWEALGADGKPRDPWADGALVAAPYNTALRVNPPLRDPTDAAACLAALLDGTADAVATDHAPHTVVDKEVEFGRAANGISGIETALGVLLALVDAGKLPLSRAVAALTSGPAGVAGNWPGAAATPAARSRGLVEGASADLVVFDRADRWLVTEGALRSKGKNSPLLGRELSGRVLLTIAGGRLAYEDPDPDRT
jgi:dihydroorotase